MRSNILAFALALSFLGLLIPAAASAGGGCPRSADRLEEFSRCLVPTPNGMRYAGTQADMDGYHARLLSTMNSQQVVPPTYVPAPSPWTTLGYPMASAMAYVALSKGYASPAQDWWLNSYLLWMAH